MNPPTSRRAQTGPAGTRRRLLAIVAIGLVCLAVGLAARHFLWLAAVRPDLNASPPPRQGLDAPFITSPDRVVDKMVELAELTERDVVYDLGCGDGRIVITAALKSGCRGVGFDIDAQRVQEARQNANQHGVADRVTVNQQDVFQVDLSQADAALMYLLPWMMNHLLPQFERMKPGARIVSHEFWIDGVEPDQYVEVPADDGLEPYGIYVYRTPLRKNPALEKGKPPRPSPQ